MFDLNRSAAGYRASFGGHSALAPTAAEAICMAALKAVAAERSR
jgi:hypothetical protein